MASRDEILLEYLELLPFAPYPVQEEALFAWASADHGVLLSAPTGTGKTLVAEAAVFEALRTGHELYYSTPLIALTDQKFQELQQTVERWGYGREVVGLVTGHRTVNAHAPIKVVVAEVLLNRLLHQEAFDFGRVTATVMDEFHHFNEPQRGIVWELALSLLPLHVRVMLLSATVGGGSEFINWLQRNLSRRITLVESTFRKVPLHFHWVGDELLPDYLERIAQGEDALRRTPALVFCFDREVCWGTADVLRGRDLFATGQRNMLLRRLDDFDFSIGSGSKLRTCLARGIGIHHAGILPKYRRVVESLFQEKLLPVCVCTETLAAGINLPARSILLSTLVKGPKDKKKLIDVGSAQQMFGRAGRPQFDSEGHVYAFAHEDDVKLERWRVKYEAISDDDKDPKMMSAKKALFKKKPSRRAGFTYWTADQFAKLQTTPPARLASHGRLNWRWLSYLLDADCRVEPIRQVMRGRLMDQPTIDAELKRLTRMLVTLSQLGVVTLDPPPPRSWQEAVQPGGPRQAAGLPPVALNVMNEQPEPPIVANVVEALKLGAGDNFAEHKRFSARLKSLPVELPAAEIYSPVSAKATSKLKDLMVFRAVHPLYGMFLMKHLGKADDHELTQILESLLEMPGSVAKAFRVPWPDELPPGRLSVESIDPSLLQLGLASIDDLYPPADQSEVLPELRRYPIPLAQKMKMIFENEVDHAGGLSVTPVWAVGDLLIHGGNFDEFVRSRDMVKQEGIVFKHLLRMILLCGEFSQLTPDDMPHAEWQSRLSHISNALAATCRAVDTQSTDELLQEILDL